MPHAAVDLDVMRKDHLLPAAISTMSTILNFVALHLNDSRNSPRRV